MKRTTCKEVKEAIRNYILESVNLIDYDIDESKLSEAEKILSVYNIFRSEKQWEISRIGEHNAFNCWLLGVPAALSIDIYYVDERRRLEAWLEESDSSKYDDEEVCNLYFHLITREFFYMVRSELNRR